MRNGILLPSSRPVPPLWLWGGMIFLPGVLVTLVFLIPIDPMDLKVVLIIYGTMPSIPGVVLGVMWYREQHRGRELAELARAMGLASRKRISSDEIDYGFALFRQGEGWQERAGHLMHGRFDGR